MADTLPEEVIYGILSRLPIKSLARFRCVCKLWLEYINDPYLRTIYVQEEPTPITFQRLPENKIKISFLRGVQQDPVLELCYTPGPYYDFLLLGSCKGLVLVSYEKEYKCPGAYRFAVINLVSKQRHDLPPIYLNVKPLLELDGPCEASGIGFDDSTNTLKTVFCFLANENRKASCTLVHSSGTSSWRRIPHAYPTSGEGIFGHRRLYWLASDYIDYNGFRKIVWLDVKTEEFGSMDPPPSPPKEGDDCFYDLQLADLNGEVGFACFSQICIKLWILKPEEEWVLHCCFDCSLIIPRPYHYYPYSLEVSGCWNKDGDILFIHSNNGDQRLFVYSLKTDLRLVLEQSKECHADIRMYRSSLFLLNTSAYSITQKKKRDHAEIAKE